jgi:hypothetical protein
MDPRVELAAMTGRMAMQVAKERITNPRPTTLREVPPSPDHLTTEWLGHALGKDVASFELSGRDDGTSSRRRLTVTFGDGDTGHYFTKSGPTFKTRLISAAADLAKIESGFYGQVRPGLDIEAPPTQYAGYDPITNRQLLIIDDLSVTTGAEFGDVLTRALTKEMAEDVVDTLAVLHTAHWGKPLQRLYGTWLVPSYAWQARLMVTINARKRILVGVERGREVIPPRLYERRNELPDALMRSLEINNRGPQTMLHSDVHPGNWYVTREGRMGLCDWQCITQGGWALDVAYALSAGLTTEQRRDWEAGLIDRYCERLDDAGIERPADAFLEYRQQMHHAMFMWLGTIGRHPLQDELQAPDITLELVRRICTAGDDLDALGALDERPRVTAAA